MYASKRRVTATPAVAAAVQSKGFVATYGKMALVGFVIGSSFELLLHYSGYCTRVIL